MKSLYQKANEILEKIEFSKKTKLLTGIIAFGMMAIGFFMLVSIFAIKYDYETLYQKRTLPQINLEDIKDIYSVNILDTLNDIKNREIDTEDSIEVIESSKEIIRSQWTSYNTSINKEISGAAQFANAWLSLFLPGYRIIHDDYYQQSLISKVKRKIKELDNKTAQIIQYVKEDDTKHINLAIESVLLDINSINIYLTSLIKSNLNDAIAEKYRNDRIFNTSIIMLFLLIGFTFFLSIIISLIITNHFKRLNESLESKVMFKTKELRELNESLEKRIRKEVANSRNKDQVMFQQAKLASLGEMLQNIAHQWRQPLGAITMIIQSFESRFISGKLDEDFIESRVNDAMLLSKNMSDTLEDFRTFFHPHKIHKKFELKRVIKKAMELTKYQLDKDKISIELDMKDEIEIYGYENELTHILLNIINNSRDAFAQADQVNNDKKKILIFVKDAQQKVTVSMVDNAGGVKDDIITKVFEPYFTTKHKSVGTGIGLYMSKQMVEKHMGGTIGCKNIQHKMGFKEGKMYQCAMFTVDIPKSSSMAKLVAEGNL
ncbi:MAG: HAMP domain-containing histidine kinase [Sulfurovum sp.]|nr:HAMP domain-containing histidine kinase [Sulfurovum sp.]